MPKTSFFRASLKKGLAGMLLLLMAVSLISYALYGPYYSPDTVNYFDFSRNIFLENIWEGIYSPFYPFVLHCLTFLSFLTRFEAANLLVLIQYGFGLYFLYRWASISATHYRFDQNKNILLLGLILILYHSWWSFRIITWAHADASFYCLLIVWGYFLSRYEHEGKRKQLIILSILSAVMIWVKLNALSLAAFYFLLFIVEKNREKWLAPLCCTLISFWGYRYFFPPKFFESGTQQGFNVSQESVGIFSNNLAELFKTTLGFIFSDVLTAFIPYVFALPGGVLILLSLLLKAVKGIKKGLPLASIFLLFSLVYLLCLLAFQQKIGFEEINYRTLFPFFLGGSWYILVKTIYWKKVPWVMLLALGFLATSHTLAGHLWLWKKPTVNSLFEVERLAESDMIKEVRSLHQEPFRQTVFASDRPEQLGLLLGEPNVGHYDPDFVFIKGKRRPLPDQQKQQNRIVMQEKLLTGEAVAVLFGGDERLMNFAHKKGLLISKFPEGVVLRRRD